MSHRLRLDRAETHLNRLQREIHEWLDENPRLPVESFDLETETHVLSLALPSPVPNHILGPLIGDVTHNLRSALDHLAYELAVAYSGDPLPDRIGGDSEFPIFLEPPSGSAWKKRVRGIAPEAQAIIKRLQPYQPGGPPLPPLRSLYGLSGIDKHRRPALCGFVVGDKSVYAHDLDNPITFLDLPEQGIIEYGTPHVFARYRTTIPKEQVNVGYGFTYDVAFMEPEVGPVGTRVLEVLWGINVYIAGAVFPALEPFLA